MPPRISSHSLQACSAEISSLASSSNSIIISSASPLERALLTRRPPALSSPSPSSSTRRTFSTTTERRRNVPIAKAGYIKWMRERGKDLESHTPGQTNYLGGESARRQPFPSNPAFTSQPVLSEEAREMIWKRVFMDEEPIKVVSAQLGVDHRRVAAVVRMKTVEKEWEKEGRKLAVPYSRAVLEMVPTHSYPDNQPIQPLEPFNEIHVHGYTMQQLFVPTSESRHFTREDAAKAFHHTMLSADARIPHKELVSHQRRVHEGMREKESEAIFVKEARASQMNDEARERAVEEHSKRLTTAVPTERFEFRFKKMTVDDVGRTGRARSGVGWRYGIPSEDRKKDQVKIPTKID
ncbi:hypothetical protein M406DRAFT_354926 [Cryphonectria parasitica EP155]|uniref:37S ribosomal protein S35, mitochondrial n=1 Tax=Cryphonectria parasitica (strain ATCC 38755 / EP155) TaxID=660469 RepID=A0A9P4Y8X3_CRYP1|nr:uncharacterized protein M406DRAFT_354926 [Cryphonectria parasitica EP155]KAF3768584.1 hypothetical protein M406DRAFT_354926 [Cryphonectria parasitica EP155]